MARGLELGDLYGPFQPKPFWDSVFLSVGKGQRRWLSWNGAEEVFAGSVRSGLCYGELAERITEETMD